MAKIAKVMDWANLAKSALIKMVFGMIEWPKFAPLSLTLFEESSYELHQYKTIRQSRDCRRIRDAQGSVSYASRISFRFSGYVLLSVVALYTRLERGTLANSSTGPYRIHLGTLSNSRKGVCKMVRTTREQRLSIFKKWDAIANVSKVYAHKSSVTYSQFRRSIQPTIGCDGAIAVQWCGMWLCIEKDGYCHS